MDKTRQSRPGEGGSVLDQGADAVTQRDSRLRVPPRRPVTPSAPEPATTPPGQVPPMPSDIRERLEGLQGAVHFQRGPARTGFHDVEVADDDLVLELLEDVTEGGGDLDVTNLALEGVDEGTEAGGDDGDDGLGGGGGNERDPDKEVMFSDLRYVTPAGVKEVAAKIEPLQNFLEQRAIPHQEAVARVQAILLAEQAEGFELDLDIDKALQSLPEEHFVSDLPRPDVSALRPREDDERRKLRRRLKNRWRRFDPPLAFPHEPAMDTLEPNHNVTPFDLAVDCPRMIMDPRALAKDGIDVVKMSDLDAIRYMLMFALNARTRSGQNPREAESMYRKAYFAAQIAALVAVQRGKAVDIKTQYDEHPEVTVRSLSTAYFASKLTNGAASPEWDQDMVREYLDAMLSLILPEQQELSPDAPFEGGWGEILQEDIVTADLKGLAQAAGLWAEYKDIFKGLLIKRMIQFYESYHFADEAPDGKKRVTFGKLVEEAVERGETEIASIGTGIGVFAAYVAEKYGVAIRGVDVTNDHNKREETLGDVTVAWLPTRVAPAPEALAQDPDAKGPEKDPEELMEAVFKAISPSGRRYHVVDMHDVAHETPDPAGYIIRAYMEVLKRGGVLSLDEPVYCEGLDKGSWGSVLQFDSTGHENSMWSLEQYLDVITFLTLMGAEIVSISVDSGNWAGFNDEFARLRVQIRKPEKHTADGKGVPLYDVPGLSDQVDMDNLVEIGQIMNVFPLNLLSPDKKTELVRHGLTLGGGKPNQIRRQAFEGLWAITSQHVSGSLAPLKRMARGIARAVRERSTGEDEDKTFLEEGTPMKYLEDLFANIKQDDRHLLARRTEAAYVVAIVNLLKRKPFEINVPLGEVPGWESMVD